MWSIGTYCGLRNKSYKGCAGRRSWRGLRVSAASVWYVRHSDIDRLFSNATWHVAEAVVVPPDAILASDDVNPLVRQLSRL
jgi:hypothetical protein